MSLGIRANLFAGFGVVLALLVAIGFIGLRNTTELASQFKTLYDNRMMSVMKLTAAQQGLYELRLGTAGANYLSMTPQQRAVIKAQDEQWLKLIDDNMRSFAVDLLPEETTGLQDWNIGYQSFLKTRQQIIELTDSGNVTAAAALRIGDFSAEAQQSDQSLNRLLAVQQVSGKQMSDAAVATSDLWQRVLVFFTLLALGVGLGVAYFVSRGVARGVQAVQKVLTSLTENCARFLEEGLAAMSANDLSVAVLPVTQPIERYGRDEIGQTAMVTNTLLARVHSIIASYERARLGMGDLVGQVRSASDSLADSASQLGITAHQTGAAVEQVTTAVQNVATGAQDTSRGAQETNIAVTQLAQAITGIARGASEQAEQVQAANNTAIEMASGVNQVALTAAQVESASHETRSAAEHGGIAVRETTAAMAEIQLVVGQAANTVEELGKLGDKIGAVVETIDDIAEQTNLLALNAAIEAARAGEHGRGFAVVADEVRKLAERSSRETKQIAELIQQVQAGTRHAVTAMQAGAAKVTQGSQKAGLAGQALEAILSAVEHTVRQAREIASASRELAAGALLVTDAMTSISAIVEENTAATEQMSAQSSQVALAIESIAAVAEEQSASTEQVSASAEEMSVQIDEMTAQAQELSTTAEQLRTLVTRFRLEEAIVKPASKILPLRRAA